MTQRKIFWFWLPLAASWSFMILQGPVVQAAIARLPEATINLAAAGIAISLAVTIESPVIMLLATSTALAANSQAYQTLRRFVLHLSIITTIIAAAIAFIDPVYDAIVPGLMGIPAHIAQAAQPGLKIMTLWSAVIAWRRFYQGILIRFDQTRLVGYGTAVRLSAVAVTTIVMVVFVDVSGVVVAASSWMAGVTSELIYAYWVTRLTIIRRLTDNEDEEQTQLTYGEIVRYHAPLAATSLLTLLAQPMIGAGLARMLFPDENLAAWPIIFSVWLFFRSGAFALPEVIVALLKNPPDFSQLQRFSRWVAGGASLILGVVAVTPLMDVYLLDITGITTSLAQFVVAGVIAGLLLPALHAIQSWQRGLLMVVKNTKHIYWGMGVNLMATGLALALGVWWQAPGAPGAAIALSVGMLVEIIYLGWRVKPVRNKFQFALQPTA